MDIPDDCKELTKNPKIVLQEKQSKITFINQNHEEIVVVTVDGCAITQGRRCDYLLIAKVNKEHYVELKGSDIDHAIDQLERTIDLLSVNKQRQEKWCFIISSRSPLLTPKIQELKVKFKKQYNATLIVKNRQYEHTL